MAPQPPAAQQEQQTKAQDAAELKAANELADSHKQIGRAMDLEYDRAVLGEKITANRTYLRLMAENDELTEAQEDWLDDFYPQKEKGESRSDDEIDATRKAKEIARKRGKAKAKA